MIWAFFGPLFYILLLSIVGIYAFKKRFNFQFVLPIVLIAATLFVYLFTFITHSITAGLLITAASAVMAVPLIVLDKARMKTLRRRIKRQSRKKSQLALSSKERT